MSKFYDNLDKTIAQLKEAGTYKSLQFLTGPISGTAAVEGKDDVVLLCSNNYIGLANKPELIDAGIAALQKYGAGAASVRFICGTYDIHRDLERKIAGFLKTEAALTYTSAWAANTGVIPALLSPGDTVISDELNHASIIDGCRAAHKEVKKMVYRHSDMQDLEQKLKEATDGNKLIITDGVFSMEGDIAPLPEILKLAKKYDAIVMVDDSHATGAIGKTGRGTAEHYGLEGQVDIITGTLGKALGGAGGGFVAGKKSVIDICVQRSRPHLFSNSLPPALAAIGVAALTYLENHPDTVTSLHKKVAYLRDKLTKAGIKPLEGDSAIVPVIVGDTAKSIKIASEMLAKGVYAIGFGFPVVPEGTARIRIQVSDALTYENIDYAAKVMAEVFANHGFAQK